MTERFKNRHGRPHFRPGDRVRRDGSLRLGTVRALDNETSHVRASVTWDDDLRPVFVDLNCLVLA